MQPLKLPSCLLAFCKTFTGYDITVLLPSMLIQAPKPVMRLADFAEAACYLVRPKGARLPPTPSLWLHDLPSVANALHLAQLFLALRASHQVNFLSGNARAKALSLPIRYD